MGVETKSKKPKKPKKSKKTISFEEEIVTRDEAQKLLKHSEKLEEPTRNSSRNDDQGIDNTVIDQIYKADDLNAKNAVAKSTKKNKKRGQRKPKAIDTEISDDVHQASVVVESEPSKKIKKRKKDKSATWELNESELPDTVEEEPESVTPKKKRKKRDAEPIAAGPGSEEPNAEEPGAKKESIRQRKKKKHLKLMEEKKMKVDVQLQQKALEYLSRWKHSRNSWKFEKLKQIWLQQNLFESTKVPSEFWDTTLEYFTSARGKVKTVLIQKALKIIQESKPIEDDEGVGESEEQSDDEELVKAKRARDIMQYLQEE